MSKTSKPFILCLGIASFTTFMAHADVAEAPVRLSDEEKIFSEVAPKVMALFRLQQNREVFRKECQDLLGKIISVAQKEGLLGVIDPEGPALKMLVEKAPQFACEKLSTLVISDLIFSFEFTFPDTRVLDFRSKGLEDGDVAFLQRLIAEKLPNLQKVMLGGNKISEENINKLRDQFKGKIE